MTWTPPCKGARGRRTRQQPTYAPELSRRSIYVTNGEECHLLQVVTTDRSHITMTPVPELRCNHKKADSCLLLRASHLAHHGSSAVVLRSPESDLSIIAIEITHTIPATMLFNIGTQQRKRNIDITQIGSTIGPDMCEALIGYHALSGCDSTSAFVGHGKTKGYKLLHDHCPFRSTMAKVGKSFVADEELLQEGEAAVCALYGRLQE